MVPQGVFIGKAYMPNFPFLNQISEGFQYLMNIIFPRINGMRIESTLTEVIRVPFRPVQLIQINVIRLQSLQASVDRTNKWNPC